MFNVVIVLEEEVVMENVGDFTDAFIVLFGLLYALNVEKNKELKYMFEFFQQVFLNIRNKSTRGVQSLRTKLSQM